MNITQITQILRKHTSVEFSRPAKCRFRRSPPPPPLAARRPDLACALLPAPAVEIAWFSPVAVGGQEEGRAPLAARQ